MVDLAATDEVSPERAGADPAARARCSTSPSCSSGRGWSSARRPTSPWPTGTGHRISAVTGEGVRELVGRMASLVHEARSEQPRRRRHRHHPSRGRGAAVERIGEHEFRLLGRQVERVVALNDVTTPEALSYIDYQLKRLGVPRLLARAGAQDGDVVWIAGFSFEYQPDGVMRRRRQDRHVVAHRRRWA